MAAVDLDKLLRGAHGCISFSPTKGHRCDLLLQDESWVSGYGKTIRQAVMRAVKAAETKGVPFKLKSRSQR